MIAGGNVGFGIGVLSGLATDGAVWPAILLRASVCALTVGLLLRWWGRIWSDCWRQSLVEHQAGKEKSQTAPLTALPR